MLGLTESASHYDLTGTPLAVAAAIVFVLAYALVVLEDVIHLRKSKPVILAAGLIWVFTAAAIAGVDQGADIGAMVKHHVADFGEIFLFLMVAMTYISAISERNVFLKINAVLVNAGFGLRAVFWATGAIAFCLSPIADNLTTAMIMGAVVCTVGRGNPRFIAMACTNVVVAANAGGAFSPFGDITTLMVWQAEKVHTSEFLSIFLPSLVNWLLPAFAMSLAVPKIQPQAVHEEAELKDGWLLVVLMFFATIATTVLFHALLHIPPFLGMTTGMCLFMFYGYYRKMVAHKRGVEVVDVLKNVAEVEWDTLLFFFGVIMCVGGLRELGYLAEASHMLYDGLGATWANVGIGIISAILDNVPVMFAVLGMDPTMGATPEASLHQWLLVTLTAGVGGSLLSVGSAAGVALMGTARGQYTFFAHLRWMPVIAVGYAASIWLHFLINAP